MAGADQQHHSGRNAIGIVLHRSVPSGVVLLLGQNRIGTGRTGPQPPTALKHKGIVQAVAKTVPFIHHLLTATHSQHVRRDRICSRQHTKTSRG